MWKDDLEGLMMLFDGVLDPTQEALMRARIADEPELARQWDELQQLRDVLKYELRADLSPNFTDQVMKEVRQTDQVPPSFVDRIFSFLSRPIAIPITAAATVAIMWAIGLPNAVAPSPVNTPAVASTTTIKDSLAAGETEIESIDNPTDYNVLVLAAPGSPNRMIWISQRTLNDEG